MKKLEPFRWPADDEHTAIFGRNGTGKSQFGAHVLSMQDLTSKPWIVLDYKGEELFNAIPNIREITRASIPEEPGLYILHSRPDEELADEDFLWSLWDRERTGLFVDEGYMLPEIPKGAFHALLTQGRSKRIPVITLSQRPVRVPRVVFSESSHVATFALNDRRDRKTLEELVPTGFCEWCPPGMPDGVPKYHARWYSVKADQAWIVKPVPDAETIIEAINVQLKPKSRWV